MIRKRLLLVIGCILVLGLMQTSMVGAGTRDGLRWTAGCDGFTSSGGAIILDRDNTGAGQERFVITAVDGNGTVIFGPVEDSFFIGSRLSFTQGVYFPYATAPAANPILVTVTSSAGNGLSQQTIYGTVGTCEGLPINNGNTLLTTEDVVEGGVSPSVPLNVVPPRPTNPDGIGATRDGFVIVNTASLNIRSGDGPEYTIVGRVDGGTELIVVGRNPDRSWWYVQVGDIRGWVNGTLVLLRGDLTQAPITPVTGELFPPRFYVYAAIMLRSAPSALAAPVCAIDGDLEYFIAGQNSDGSWIEINVQCDGVGTTGWLPLENGAIRNSGSLSIPVTAQ